MRRAAAVALARERGYELCGADKAAANHTQEKAMGRVTKKDVEEAAQAVGLRLLDKKSPGAWILVDAADKPVFWDMNLAPLLAHCRDLRQAQEAPETMPAQMAATPADGNGADDPPVVGVPAVVVDAERTEGAALTEIDRTYGYGLIYDRDRLAAEVPQIMGQAVLEAGRRLILLKEHEPHGQWLLLLEQMGIDRTTAGNMMNAARKFIGSPNCELVRNLDSITKVYELARLDDEDLDELREGGTIAGATLDDIQRMSPSELRATLRAERKERRERDEAQRERLAKKGRQIDDLEEAARQARRRLDEYRLGAVSWSERESNILIALASAEQDAIKLCARVRAAITLLEQLAADEAGRTKSAKELNSSSATAAVRAAREQVTRIIDHLGAEANEIGEIISMPLPCEQATTDIE